MVNPSQLLQMAGGTAFKTEWKGAYQWHDVTNPKYNTFFRQTLPRANAIVLTGAIFYSFAILFMKEPGR